jgi:hypothetical protein
LRACEARFAAALFAAPAGASEQSRRMARMATLNLLVPRPFPASVQRSSFRIGLGAASLLLASAQSVQAAAGRPAGVRWQAREVALAVAPSLDGQLPGAAARAVAAGATWQSVGTDAPRLSVTVGPVGPVGYAVGGKNQNTLRVAAKGDPVVKQALAVTVLTYDATSRTILDADVVLSSAHRFSDLETAEWTHDKTYDLQAVLTHELGHFHGLGDDLQHQHAAMYFVTSPMDIRKRALSPEDEEAIISLYAAGAGDDGAAQACSSPAGRSNPGSSALMVWALALTALAVRRRARLNAAAALGLCVGLVAGPGSTSEPLAAPEGAASARIVAANARWVGGLILTELELSDGARASVLGGRVGDIVQIVSHAPPLPELGARVQSEGDDHE